MVRTRNASKPADAPEAKKARTEAPAEKLPKKLAIGDKIPDISLEDESGNEVNVGNLGGIVVMFAYPKAKTPGCTRQTRGFGQTFEDFEKAGAKVYGLSADSVKTQAGFKSSLELPFSLLSDPGYKLLGPLGAQKHPKGVIRSHWVFKDNKLVFVEHSVKPDTSPAVALEAALGAAGETGPTNGVKAEAKEPKEPKEEEAANGKVATEATSNGDAKETNGEPVVTEPEEPEVGAGAEPAANHSAAESVDASVPADPAQPVIEEPKEPEATKVAEEPEEPKEKLAEPVTNGEQTAA